MTAYSLQGTSYTDTCSWTSFHNTFGQNICPSPESFTGALTYLFEFESTDEDNQTVRDVWTRHRDCIDRYCVFSNAGLFGQGVSLMTTPENYDRVTRINSHQAGFPAGYPKFRAAEVQGKGTGLIANETIRRGERIMASKPALLVHQNALADLEWEEFYHLLDTAVNSLPDARRTSYLAQVGQMGGHKNTDILFTNSFQISLAEQDGFHYGNFPGVSQLNHDCRPNLAFYVDESLTHYTHAIRDIESGEELTISYLDSFQSRALRQARAYNAFGFSCSCSQCSMPREEIERSDSRLISISQIENELAGVNNYASVSALIEHLLGLYYEEHLDFKIAGAYTLAALNYNMFSKKEIAQKYARLAVEAGLLEHGSSAPDVQEMRVLHSTPEDHWSWGLKVS
ncbi:SET domain-containing protein [Xylariaceae sp. FL0662B]|nr:SET domain-containing protein [Xylariaceae sp. FL0662B]